MHQAGAVAGPEISRSLLVLQIRLIRRKRAGISAIPAIILKLLRGRLNITIGFVAIRFRNLAADHHAEVGKAVRQRIS
ncbi:hypothetical protein [Granulibacter bethesdensis]|uniref:hypothetical protein n=1 Tax=Granulibacter bethesdensis TaxID=364410 RepID=UPI0012FD57CD|nr:hypothetical protein [Granulibacter bethesdensis]